ncbi:hypothetical protein MUK42_29541 [Musa troglodytarum]|uniref:Uncharacterized protein n=1 Tax=Musa troglodytarum TaxID=320322 RepID=A0A9E7GYT1_9LILI|nr:hypothetical protein MUK42_29541 [Musa troglodytarum]
MLSVNKDRRSLSSKYQQEMEIILIQDGVDLAQQGAEKIPDGMSEEDFAEETCGVAEPTTYLDVISCDDSGLVVTLSMRVKLQFGAANCYSHL